MAETNQPVPQAPELPQAGSDEVALLVDGRPVVVKKGTTVLEAAKKLGVEVPHYCYHPGLSVAGNCRMCLVEIEKMPKLQIGCATVASQGMSVRTSSERVRDSRQGILEFLLINHPLDCPICDQAGECRLQEYAADHGRGYSRFEEEKVHGPKRYDIGERVVFDSERCIKCTRCVRFCDEISDSHELTLLQRGDHAIIGTFPGMPLNNPYSGCTVDVCPVGALTWKQFRFKARVWFLNDTPSVCAGCARGCSVNVANFKNRIQRMTPRFNESVNGHWMCDEGRASFSALYERPRVERPLLAREAGATGRGGTGRQAGWEEALDRAADLLRDITKRHGAGSLAALVSARGTVEDLYLAKRVLGETIGIPRIAVPPHERGEDDALLIRRDRTPNAFGAAVAGPGAPDASRVKEIMEDVVAGRVRGLLVLGEDPVGEGLIDAAALADLEALVVLDWWKSPTAEAADVVLPICGYGEYEGVHVNFQGHAQRARAALKPAGEAEPAWSVLDALGQRFGYPAGHRSASGIFEEIAEKVAQFGGQTYRTLGESGVRLKGV